MAQRAPVGQAAGWRRYWCRNSSVRKPNFAYRASAPAFTAAACRLASRAPAPSCAQASNADTTRRDRPRRWKRPDRLPPDAGGPRRHAPRQTPRRQAGSPAHPHARRRRRRALPPRPVCAPAPPRRGVTAGPARPASLGRAGTWTARHLRPHGLNWRPDRAASTIRGQAFRCVAPRVQRRPERSVEGADPDQHRQALRGIQRLAGRGFGGQRRRAALPGSGGVAELARRV